MPPSVAHRPPMVSVVVPARNDAAALARCLDALSAQTRLPDEIVVVDNDSTDDTERVARDHTASGVRVVCERVHGIWPAAARGYDDAHGDLIARLDADSIPSADWLERAVDALAAHPEWDILVGRGDFYGDRKLVDWLGNHLYIGGLFAVVTPYLGHPPLFGSNFVMRSEAWSELRSRVHRDNAHIHDDLDMSFNIPPHMTVHYDAQWRVGISDRPFDTLAGFGRRLGWVGTTVRANWPESGLRHRRERCAWQRSHSAGL